MKLAQKKSYSVPKKMKLAQKKSYSVPILFFYVELSIY